MARRQPTEAQRAQAAERRERMRALAKRVSAMSDAERQGIADRFGVVSVEGRALSVFNSCMVWMQNPAASVVGGFQQWRKAGRCVRKGEHGAAIWVPVGRDAGENPASAADLEDGKGAGVRFVLGTVFDIAQTDAVEALQTAAA